MHGLMSDDEGMRGERGFSLVGDQRDDEGCC